MGLLDRIASLIGRESSDTPSRTVDAGVGAGARDGDEDDAPDPVPDPSTPRDHVLRLLVQNDGRVTKSTLVEEMSVSESELSRLLADMEADDDVRMVSHRRDVLVCRPGYEPPQHRQI